MEEDIKVLKDLKNKWELNYFGDMVNVLSLNEMKVVDNILNELERLQKENELLENTKDTCPEMATSGFRCHLKNALNSKKTVHTCLHCNENTPLYCENCYQDLISKNAELQLENEKLKRLHINIQGMRNGKELLNKYINDSIPKQAIRDKIELFTKQAEEVGENKCQWTNGGVIDLLKEILGE